MTKISTPTHFKMFQAIADFLDEHTELDEDSATIVAGELLTSICDNAELEVELDEDWVFSKLTDCFLADMFGGNGDEE